MQTCLSDERPVASLLLGLFWIAIGTWHLFLWHSEIFAEFGWTWIFFPIALAQYGLGALILRNGVSYRSEWALKLLEPNR